MHSETEAGVTEGISGDPVAQEGAETEDEEFAD